MAGLVITQGYGEGGGVPLTLFSLVQTDNNIRVTFDRNVLDSVQLRDLSNWSVTGPSTITITAVTPGTNYVDVTLYGGMTGGGAYTLHIGAGTVRALSDEGMNDAIDKAFVGVHYGPVIMNNRVVDCRELAIFWNAPVVEADATNPVNYTLSGGLTVTAARKLSSIEYRLTTDKQLVGTGYTLTASNINDFTGNVT